MQDYEGTFSEMDESGYYWTSTEYDKNNAEYFSYLLINEIPVIDISRQEDIADIHGTEKTQPLFCPLRKKLSHYNQQLMTFAEKVISFYSYLGFTGILPEGIAIMNPFRENPKIIPVITQFYSKFYSDNNITTSDSWN